MDDEPRFLTLPEVAKILATTKSQTYALVRNKELRAVKIGGRGQWRVERTELEMYISRIYTDTEKWIDEHPYVGADTDDI